jgi:hypothetical protein
MTINKEYELITNSLISKTNSIMKFLEDFDNIFKILINIKDIRLLTAENITQIAKLTELYIFIRSEHGSLIILLDKLKDQIQINSTNLSDKLINDQYTLSTFYSILENISHVISNIDFEYKKIATKFPKFINKKALILILVVKNKDDEFVKIIEDLQKEFPENVYKVIINDKEIINVKDVINKDLPLKIKKMPSLFILNDDIITEISLDENSTLESLRNLIK